MEGANTPSDLTLDQRAAVMRDYFDQSLRTAGGSKALESIGDRNSAAALADTVYRHGSGGGTALIQKAINAVEPGSVKVDSLMGKQTVEAYRRLASNPQTRQKLLQELGDLRKAENPGETDRFEHFKYGGSAR